MNGRIVSIDSEQHFEAQLLLPWYVAESLEEADQARVEAHLADCARCQADVAWQRRLQGARLESPTEGDVERGLAAALSQIASEKGASRGARAARHVAARWPGISWWRMAFAIQFAATLGLALLVLSPRPPEAAYHALGAAPTLGADLIVVFRATATEPEIRHALRASGTHLVGGPTVTNAYLLGVDAAQRASALEQLRQAPAVAEVHSLDARP